MDKFINWYKEWLSKELEEEITTSRAIYLTLWVVCFMITIIGGMAESTTIAIIGIVLSFYFGIKAKVFVWQKRN